MKSEPTPALMFQGTGSNAGKSLMTAAFCRILADEGVRVAPFKAQNMSLNSWVTADGREMGRAQVLQAMAARVEPHVDMNPLLLKPTGDQGSQVILNGKPLAQLQARQYYDRKADLVAEVHAAYDRLAADYDAIVLEGAGSPGEVNLKKHDLVNMPMARHAKAPVILVGDIDRGGVYASFVGHVEVMDQWERDLLAGFLVNKFRGDATLLAEAHDYMLEKTGKPVLGVMPWIRGHRLPEEDGVDFEERYGKGSSTVGRQDDESDDDGAIVIGVVELPHISNSTDIDAFLGEEDVRLVRIDSVEKLRETSPLGVIIPGTRNVIADLEFLRRRGLVQELTALAKSGDILLVGICGGFQMLGRTISDPSGLEVAAGSGAGGLGLLDAETVLEDAKTLTQTTSTWVSDGSSVVGYEIHHGRSVYRDKELFSDPGLGCRRDNVWGTYLHGIFDNDGVRRSFLFELGRNSSVAGSSTVRTIDRAIDDFTDVFRRSVDIGFLKRTMGL